jgi:hypothetical protein
LNKTGIKVSPCEEADLDLGVPSRDWLSGRHSSETIKMLNDGPLDVRYGSRLCKNVREQRMRRIVFSLVARSTVLSVLFFSYST